jgi:hypothetical protein
VIPGEIMRAPQLPQIDLAEVGLKLTGVALAGGSLAFAAHMMSDPNDQPRITGVEHFAIYAKPARHVAQQLPPPRLGVDTMPVGSIKKSATSAVLTGYELLEASPEWALLRLPEGRITRVSRGGRIGGLGGVLSIEKRGENWALVTEKGVIRAR